MSGRSIAVIGANHVGLTIAASLATQGHTVVCAGIDAVKVAVLRRGEILCREDGLRELVADGLSSTRLRFVVGGQAAVADAEFVFLCVPTGSRADGGPDLRAIESSVVEVSEALRPGAILINTVAVPVGTANRIAALLRRPDVHVVSNPEFLREGTSVHDFRHPDRIVIGGGSDTATARVAGLYRDIDAPIVRTDTASAEMIKYAANSFLAMKLSYVNTISALCEHLGADMADVVTGLGHDPRIGSAFLRPGPGWGGSCLPKDTSALLQLCTATDFEFPLLAATMDSNLQHQERIVEKIRGAVGGPLRGKLICLFGLTFKAGTNDLRDSPAIDIAELLYQEGAEIVAYDPAVPQAAPGLPAIIDVVEDPVVAAAGASAIVVLTEWPEFAALPWAELEAVVMQPVVVDARNLLDAERVAEHGFTVHQLGTRPRIPDPTVLLCHPVTPTRRPHGPQPPMPADPAAA